jgi:hypothetical protein
LGAASRSAGFILERYWSFFNALFSFAEEASAVGCLLNSWTLLLFVLTNVSNFLSTDTGNILLLSQISISNCCWSSNCFTVERGVCEQPQVIFLS